MEMILGDIEKALDAGCYYVAVHMVLTLPDICSALEASNGETSGKQYRAWYNHNLAAVYPCLSAVDCYSLRCGVIHQGRFGHSNMQYSRVIFSVPDGRNLIWHNNIINDALNLDVTIFCKDFLATAKDWYKSKQNDSNVQNNLPRLIEYRPSGLAPYIIGLPVIS